MDPDYWNYMSALPTGILEGFNTKDDRNYQRMQNTLKIPLKLSIECPKMQLSLPIELAKNILLVCSICNSFKKHVKLSTYRRK